MGYLSSLEFFAAMVRSGEMTPEAAAQQFSDESNGGLTPLGAADLISKAGVPLGDVFDDAEHRVSSEEPSACRKPPLAAPRPPARPAARAFAAFRWTFAKPIRIFAVYGSIFVTTSTVQAAFDPDFQVFNPWRLAVMLAVLVVFALLVLAVAAWGGWRAVSAAIENAASGATNVASLDR